MYPLTLIRIAKGKRLKFELKNGDLYEGNCIKCDLYMNLHLSKVSVKTGTESYKYLECYVKGAHIKHFDVPKFLMDVQEKNSKKKVEC
ncbi:hypothetical protein H311_03774 [Anncaliia algerae PRA109]|nr:hypothetical protein H311_03774 [Anncaliia algerae PRA109]